jgi:hypothetical protein
MTRNHVQSASIFDSSRAVCLVLVRTSRTSATATKSQATMAEIEAFWQKTLARVSAEPLDVETEPVREALPYKKYQITYRSLDGVKVRAYLGVPIQGETTAGRYQRSSRRLGMEAGSKA